MPKPVDGRARYLAGLDGIRALAVIAVFGYHLGFESMGGGLLGVGVFFTLSGFLITRILLGSWQRTGTLELRRFWVHRARRLLPALLVVLVVVLAATAL
ncbi:MAG: acyltransferase family protein, partial [Nocardioidaceae bacterium]